MLKGLSCFSLAMQVVSSKKGSVIKSFLPHLPENDCPKNRWMSKAKDGIKCKRFFHLPSRHFFHFIAEICYFIPEFPSIYTFMISVSKVLVIIAKNVIQFFSVSKKPAYTSCLCYLALLAILLTLKSTVSSQDKSKN